MKHPVCYYWKDPTTSVEMNFTQDENLGWCVGFPKSSIDEALDYKGEIPFPELSPEEQKVVDANYEKLYEDMRRDED